MAFQKKIIFLVIILILTVISPAYGQQYDAEEIKNYFVQEFNRILREDYNSVALARSEILDEIAQNIADNIGCREDPIEFDIQGDAVDLGYKPYPGFSVARTTRVPLVPVVNNRPIESLIQNYANVIYSSNINRANLFYREIGVGVSVCTNTRTPQYSLFVVLGAQPDVIPVVVENGDASIEVESVPATVMLSIHEEKSRRSPGIFGKAATMRLSTTSIDERVQPQDYAPAVEFELTQCGQNTIYYELTDTEGVVVTGEVPIEVICAGQAEETEAIEVTEEADSEG